MVSKHISKQLGFKSTKDYDDTLELFYKKHEGLRPRKRGN